MKELGRVVTGEVKRTSVSGEWLTGSAAKPLRQVYNRSSMIE